MAIQTSMTERALELLNLESAGHPMHLLDIGCGSGLSGEAMTDAGHIWTGIDISTAMLGVAVARGVEGSLLCVDIGTGLPFKPSSFDGAISISVIQWLCNADQSNHSPTKRLHSFFSSLHRCLSNSARAVFQFYPESPAQISLITESALRSGFSGGVVIDFPNSTKAKKYFLCLNTGLVNNIPKPLINENDVSERKTVQFSRVINAPRSKSRSSASSHRAPVKSKDWILAKKERQRKQGKQVARDSKFTGRKRKPNF